MKHKFLKTAGICAAALLMCVNCYASDVAYRYVDSELTISGTAAEGDMFVALEILKAGKEFDTAIGDEDVMFCEQAVPESGKYKFDVEYDCESGEYAARISTNTGIKETFDIVIVSSDDTERAYIELNESAEKDDFDTFKTIINTDRTALNFGFVLSDGKVLGSELKDYFEYVKKNPLNIEEESTNTSIYKTFITADALNGGKVDNINDVIEGLYFEDAEVLKDYLAVAETAGVQKYFTDKMSGEDIDNLDSFENTAIKALILTQTRYADGGDEVKSILAKYGSLIGITKTAKDSVYRQLAGKDFEDCTELKNKFSDLSKESGSGNKGGSGGSGGGGGVKGSFSGEYTMDHIEDAEAPETIKMSFEDLDGVLWAQEAILALADMGIVNGKGNDMFAPDDNVTREEFTKILVGAMNLDKGQAVSGGFDDVSENEWYFRYVNIAKEEGIVSGIGGGLFGVGSPITREDMAVMIYNALNSKNVKMESVALGFADAGEISDYATEAVGALYNMGAVNGVSETEFSPKGLATRAQAAQIIYNVIELLQ